MSYVCAECGRPYKTLERMAKHPCAVRQREGVERAFDEGNGEALKKLWDGDPVPDKLSWEGQAWVEMDDRIEDEAAAIAMDVDGGEEHNPVSVSQVLADAMGVWDGHRDVYELGRVRITVERID